MVLSGECVLFTYIFEDVEHLLAQLQLGRYARDERTIIFVVSQSLFRKLQFSLHREELARQFRVFAAQRIRILRIVLSLERVENFSVHLFQQLLLLLRRPQLLLHLLVTLPEKLLIEFELRLFSA